MTTIAAARRSPATCDAAGELIALDAFRAQRGLRYTPPRRMPKRGHWLTRVIAIGDRVVPVPRDRLGLRPTEAGANARVVVAGLEDEPVGFVVYAVRDVTAVEALAMEGGADV